MIEIKINSHEKSREKFDSERDAVRMASEVSIQAGGEGEEIKHELIALLETFEKHELLACIWHEALREHLFDLEKGATHEHTSA